MVDLNALERQLADESLRIVGPARPVDDLAIFDAASRSQKWGFTMFSALKFVAAGVIVALFGGFLLAGILATPQDGEMAPAAATESPSSRTAEETLSGMITEEVEPGVFRVVHDGVRDHSYPVGGWGHTGFEVDVTPDGSVWLSADVGREGLYQIGEEPVFEDVAYGHPYREVAPDGSLWAFGEVSDDRHGIYSFDGEGWTVRATTTIELTALAVGPVGTVWVGSADTAPLRLEDDGSLTTVEGWADVYDGDASPHHLAVSPDGDVMLVGTGRALLRFDGKGWEAIPAPEGWNPVRGRYLDVGPDGTLWAKANAKGDLARFDGSWTTFTKADGVQPWGKTDWSFADVLDVAADGSLWLLGSWEEGCDGVAHYQGTTWTWYLAGHCIHDFAIAPDGSVWLGANAYDNERDIASPAGLYVITPEAVAGKER